jgi:hypothetical protein
MPDGGLSATTGLPAFSQQKRAMRVDVKTGEADHCHLDGMPRASGGNSGRLTATHPQRRD